MCDFYERFKEIDKIYETNDYNIFNFEKTNRVVKNFSKLKKDIEENGLMYEILVNSDLVIIDGQHRYNALKELGMPIQFKIKRTIGIKEMIGINSVSKNWGEKDFVSHYSRMGIKPYQELIQHSKEHNVSVSTLYRSKLCSGDVKTGSLKIYPFYKVKDILEKIDKFF